LTAGSAADAERDSHAPESTASLRIWSDSLSLADISAALGTPPTRGRDKGAPRTGRAAGIGPYKETLWLLESSSPRRLPISVGEHVKPLVRFMEQKREALTTLLATCTMDWFCSYFQSAGRGGFSLAGSVLRWFPFFDMGLTLDVYPPTLPRTGEDGDDTRRWTCSRLRIESAVVSAAEISTALGLTPTRAYERGDADRPAALPAKGAVWLLDSGVDPFNNEWYSIRRLLDLANEKQAVLRQLADSCRISLRLTQASESGQAGIILSPSSMRQLALVAMDLVFTVYPPDEIETADVLCD